MSSSHIDSRRWIDIIQIVRSSNISSMWQRFTERARKVVFYAQEEAQKFGEGYVSTEHLLLGLTRETDSVAARVIEKLGASLHRIRTEVEQQLPRSDERPSQDMTLTPRAKRVIDLAYDEARMINNNYIGTEHLLLGLIREGEGLAARILDKLGIDLEGARREVLAMQGQEPRDPSAPQSAQSKRKRQSGHYMPPDAAMLLRIRQAGSVPEHLFLMLMASPESEARMIAERTIPNCAHFITQLENALLYSAPEEYPGDAEQDSLEQIFIRGQLIAQSLGSDQMMSRHLLLAIAERQNCLMGRLLTDHVEAIRGAVNDFQQ